MLQLNDVIKEAEPYTDADHFAGWYEIFWYMSQGETDYFHPITLAEAQANCISFASKMEHQS